MLNTDERKKKSLISEDQQDFIHKCGVVWRKYLAGEEVVVVTPHKIEPEVLFGDYFGVINIGIKKGLVEVVCVNDIQDKHFSKELVEF
ncbi:hypothetical protein [Klebsiella phage 05F01]|nr:hypothetical protein [Klebsiella phage 05F01]